MQAMMRIAPPQAAQVWMSMLTTRFKRCAQRIEARRSAGVVSSGLARRAGRPILRITGRQRL